MNPLPGEATLLQSDNQELVLTSHRVRFMVQATGLTRITSIMLDQITACEITTTTKPWMLVVAVLAFIGGLALNTNRDSSPVIWGAVIAAVFVIAYFGSRQGVISLRASNAAINAPIRRMPIETAKAFIDRVEAAKNERYLALRVVRGAGWQQG